ncbi:hypothetical protein C882_0931 [Caenispirillum salinarum AK4]|uniref:YjiS-like domain-containing protein n=1 Tax=Caenispirillum salinarum AK4 TaxID=1238182 RepID=K9GVI0_9PROT|nr:DUF1127 domain-containing protein [Caenispirillum salinarum]EKV28719.1 hypothetical protein C882_0931 [Caenispirillum salinarum AK4]
MTTTCDSMQCGTAEQTRSPGATGRNSGLAAWAGIAWARFRRMRAAAAQRRELAALDEVQMRDLGITTEARRRELRRPFWDI